MKNVYRHVTILSLFLFSLIESCIAAVVLDPGHSPVQPGAVSCIGYPEYMYNDALAASTQKALEARGMETTVTRDPNEHLSLAARGNKGAGKDLLVSLHHDSVQPQFLEKKGKTPMSRKAEGFSIFVSRKNPFFRQSLEYARNLGQNLLARGFRPSLHHAEKIKGENRPLLDKKLGIYAFDDLVVLKTAQCPALLLEAAVLTHPEDEKRARTASRQNAMAESIADAIQGGSPGGR